MVAILITWAAVIPILAGVGLLVQRLYGVRQAGAVQVMRAFWVGFAGTLAVAQAWSLFWPVGGSVWLVILPLGVLGLGWSWRELLHTAREFFRRPSVAVTVSVLLLLAVRIAMSAAQEVPFPDTGSYHLPATLWAHSHPVVPGLSNLNCRLGLDSSLFPYGAMFALGPWDGRPHHVVIGVFLLMLMAVALVGASRPFDQGRPRVANLLAALFFVPAMYLLVLGGRVSSLSPNVVMMFLVLAAAWQIVTALTSREGLAHEGGYTAFCGGLFLVAATTVKLIVAPFALVSLVVVLTSRGGGDRRSGRQLLLKVVGWLIISSILLGVPWLIRGFVINGYPLYPLPVAGIDADWRVPEEQVFLVTEWAQSFARRSYDRPPLGYEWFGPWASQVVQVLGFSIPLAATIFAGLCIPLLRYLPCSTSLGNRESRAYRMAWPALVALAAWFFSGPDPRYAVSYVWLLACLLGACLLARAWPCARQLHRLALFAMVATIMTAEAVWFLGQSAPAVVAACGAVSPGGIAKALTCGLRPLPAGEFRTFVTNSGLKLQVPVYGTGVWNAPLLSTPHPSPNLKLRDPNDISKGFVSDGPWKPLRFPNQWDGFRYYAAERLGLDSPGE